ncbi:hypothetical protein RHMOL_Rhmol06G0121900 [Rhododendron molle]|uniref:Uncharacterized protein n=5 Tax=Rhododendron molle TaxID=49168 RepID=A0ACC0NBD1_RHOML|nr:hypothetical protein RHMOL_Rhmol06G0121900 [Rhododendron molle]KAI8550626.1 hypothetical protein RHMOL_Rhmol06G0121900 [Rhododendron molle]KAI8550627.1 hypothetical protein RHMOL_Rhmol06G0121900 [Rhododendron molle]KAI8550629.1 hypothetical protein RHMOL_Rhmol06G0121900 [Rhododendron molle]KAI8550631.1 hypothetical protein RHMOL_Rhmol06G0121900 [Rhododendron molle]
MASSAANLHGSIALHVPVIVFAIRLLLIAEVVVPSVVRQPAVFAVNGGWSIRVFYCSSIDNFKAALASIQRQPIAGMFKWYEVQWKVVDKGALDLNYHSSTSNRKISDPRISHRTHHQNRGHVENDLG